MSILLVTNRRDLTTDFLIREFKKRNLEFNRLNTDTIANSFVTFDPESNTIQIKDSHSRICTDSISVAYFRRPELPALKETLQDYREYARTEWHSFLKTIYDCIGDRWFNHPYAILRAEDKSRQLVLARHFGFHVPETIITNDIKSVQELGGEFALVAKPLKQALVEGENSEQIIFTSSIEMPTDKDSVSVSICPIIFQRQIPKAIDIRVTVVGKQVFAVAIHSQETEETRIDWRRGSNPELEHEIIQLPKDVAAKCVQIVESQSLRFGAIDLVQDPNGKVWFLECNPNGQWAWIENRTGLPIAATITDEMLKLSKS
ncbi:MAG: hypothetical protein OXH88_06055 [Gammaproteobacteria bacterium]|nr:hypothetical protein [Gammaproteobacteria bacterium]